MKKAGIYMLLLLAFSVGLFAIAGDLEFSNPYELGIVSTTTIKSQEEVAPIIGCEILPQSTQIIQNDSPLWLYNMNILIESNDPEDNLFKPFKRGALHPSFLGKT